MMKRFILAVSAAAMSFGAAAQNELVQNVAPAAVVQSNADRVFPKTDTRWFEEARYGMFVHFGPYAVLGAGEWVMHARPITKERYSKLQDFFNPAAFDAKEWVRTAKDAGMKYMIVTSRHHDGFSMWDTKQSDWGIMNTPYGKDILKQLADECRAQGLKLGFYYSLLDWYRDDYVWRDRRTGQSSSRTAESDWASYINFMKGQLTELLTNYGDVAVIWFDGYWDQTVNKTRNDENVRVDWHFPEIYGLIKELQPNCLIANNHHVSPKAGEDYQIFERDMPGENKHGYSAGVEVARMPLESCETVNSSWGYSYTDTRHKTPVQIVNLLVRAAGHGANLLLNVGPQPDGKIDETSTARLREAGKWVAKWGHTIYGTSAGFVKPQSWGAVTMKDKTAYIHVLQAPEGGAFAIKIPAYESMRWLNLEGAVKYSYDKKTGVTTIVTNGAVKYSYDKKTGVTTIVTNEVVLDPVDSIIEVALK